jgi:membrane-associated phospholipid phosphatase
MSGHAYSAAAVRARASRGRGRRSGPVAALGVAALCVVALALVWIVAELVPSAHYKDAVLLHDFISLGRPRLNSVGETLLRALAPLPAIMWCLALMAIALARGRWRVAVAVAGVMTLAPLTTEILKPLLAHSHVDLYGLQIGAASWPSGHSTAATALALSAVLAAPVRLRPLVAVLAVIYALSIGCFLLILAWHMPSDVLGGYLVATLWAALAVAGLRAAERRWPTGRPL